MLNDITKPGKKCQQVLFDGLKLRKADGLPFFKRVVPMRPSTDKAKRRASAHVTPLTLRQCVRVSKDARMIFASWGAIHALGGLAPVSRKEIASQPERTADGDGRRKAKKIAIQPSSWNTKYPDTAATTMPIASTALRNTHCMVCVFHSSAREAACWRRRLKPVAS